MIASVVRIQYLNNRSFFIMALHQNLFLRLAGFCLFLFLEFFVRHNK